MFGYKGFTKIEKVYWWLLMASILGGCTWIVVAMIVQLGMAL